MGTMPKLGFPVWARGEMNGSFEPHLFHAARKSARCFITARRLGKPSWRDDEIQNTRRTSPSRTANSSGRDEMRLLERGARGIRRQIVTTPCRGGSTLLSETRATTRSKSFIKVTWCVDQNRGGMMMAKSLTRHATSNKLGKQPASLCQFKYSGDSDGPVEPSGLEDQAFYGTRLSSPRRRS